MSCLEEIAALCMWGLSRRPSLRIRSSEMLHAESSRMLSQRLDESLVLISYLDLESPFWHVKSGCRLYKGNTLEKLSSQSEEKAIRPEWWARPLASACACMSEGQQARETPRQSPSL